KTEFVARASGSYGLVVEARQQKAAAGRYAVRFDDLHTATEKETDLQEARIAYADSVRFRRAGKYDEAQAANQRALDIREKWLGSDSLELAAPLNNLAFVYRDKADYAKAEQLFRRALDIREKALGPQHPSVAGAANNLAILYKDMAEY